LPIHPTEMIAFFSGLQQVPVPFVCNVSNVLSTPQLQALSDPAGLPSLPEPKQALETALETDVGTMLPVPKGIRPTLAKYR
jgi:hypothetical protein